nr:vegetative cell wall protein gp1-like [Aegilops tauschii subsp. strangulata]XP_040251721.1 vegetative cell wall protein gp1-like [Aegilops tauschii subsp. strangulata]
MFSLTPPLPPRSRSGGIDPIAAASSPLWPLAATHRTTVPWTSARLAFDSHATGSEPGSTCVATRRLRCRHAIAGLPPATDAPSPSPPQPPLPVPCKLPVSLDLLLPFPLPIAVAERWSSRSGHARLCLTHATPAQPPQPPASPRPVPLTAPRRRCRAAAGRRWPHPTSPPTPRA